MIFFLFSSKELIVDLIFIGQRYICHNFPSIHCQYSRASTGWARQEFLCLISRTFRAYHSAALIKFLYELKRIISTCMCIPILWVPECIPLWKPFLNSFQLRPIQKVYFALNLHAVVWLQELVVFRTLALTFYVAFVVFVASCLFNQILSRKRNAEGLTISTLNLCSY